MYSCLSRFSILLLILVFAGAIACNAGDGSNTALPNPALDSPSDGKGRADGSRRGRAASGAFRPSSNTSKA